MNHDLLYFLCFVLISLTNIISGAWVAYYIVKSDNITSTAKFWMIFVIGARTFSVSAFIFENIRLLLPQ